MRGQHDWGHEGIDMDTGESYAYCPLCNKFCISSGQSKPKRFISKSFYNNRIKAGKVTLDGVLLTETW
jgi:hypothetical protein